MINFDTFLQKLAFSEKTARYKQKNANKCKKYNIDFSTQFTINVLNTLILHLLFHPLTYILMEFVDKFFIIALVDWSVQVALMVPESTRQPVEDIF